ncbi:MAG: ABC transporter ATP-binding protein [Deltaproteobacteria bacterium]|nr:ABC transporter ATP-binding protein [Deltaproteobacteria bacterium]
MLRVNDIDVSYGQVQILRKVSFDIQEKEIVSLLGSNGAGKTTTVSAVSGILPVSRGQVVFMDEDITRVESYDRVEMGLVQVPEGRKLFPTLTVVENLEMGSYLKGPKALRQESMAFVFTLFPVLEKRKKQLGGTLSGGEQQMLAIGRGLMAKPKLLILDEPSLGLAPIVVDEIFTVIDKINKEGVMLLLVEQNVSQALSLSTRGFVLEQGRIALSGKGGDLLDNPHVKKVYLGL